MTRRIAVLAALAAAALAAPATAQAEPAWNCSGGAGWVSDGANRATAPTVGGSPCPVVKQNAEAVTSGAGSIAVAGTLQADGGAANQTTDTRKPQVSLTADTVTVRNADGSLELIASKLRAQASGSCDSARKPSLSSTSDPGTVTLNGRPIATNRDYSEPGVGVNGAPLFGQLVIRFGETSSSGDGSSAEQGVTRRTLHVIATDRDGKVVFEAVGGEVAVGRSGPVCDPPPVCPPGQQPQEGRCVDVTIAPLPPSLPPSTPVPPVGGPVPPKKPAGCAYANALAGQVSSARLQRATLCLLNRLRARKHLRRLRANGDLGLAAARHARDMIRRRYFAHDAPGGARFIDRVFRSGYLRRYGNWSVGENLGWGWGRGASPRAIVAAWMRSAPHKRNILNRRFRDAGIAVRRGSPRKRQPRGSLVYVLDFGAFTSA